MLRGNWMGNFVVSFKLENKYLELLPHGQIMKPVEATNGLGEITYDLQDIRFV